MNKERLSGYVIEDWTSRLVFASPFQERSTGNIYSIAIHHTGGSRAQTPESIHAHHIRKGWAGLGYHYLIYDRQIMMPNVPARIIKARPIAVYPACVERHNQSILCIAWVGEHSITPPAPESWHAMVWLCAHLRTQFARRLEVKGHNEYEGHESNQCPGLLVDMDRLRDDVDNRRGL